MSDENVLEVRGDLRVRLEIESNPEKPYNEGTTPVLELPYRTSENPSFVDNLGAYLAPSEQTHIVDAAYRFRRDTDLFERYLRIFHGVSTIKWYESQDSKYVTFDTAEWREHHGITDEDAKKDEYRNSVNLNEWRAYVEGDVYGIIVEERNNWLRVSPLNPSNGNTPDMRETWEEVETTWGFYGADYAKEVALSELTEIYGNQLTPTVHKYPL